MRCMHGISRRRIPRAPRWRCRRCRSARRSRSISSRTNRASADSGEASMISRDSIARTYGVIREHVRRTPVIETDAADFQLGRFQAVFKLEMLQRAGSFKTRGAFANLLLRELPAAGVVAASGGNHGVAVAYAAQRLGVPARIFVPTVASPAKIARIRASGADVVITGDRYADALEASEQYVE